MARPGGCSFDILEFEHIGECKGTCGDQSEKIRFEMLDDGEVTLVVVELDLDSPEDMAKLEELLKQGNVREMTAVGHRDQEDDPGRIPIDAAWRAAKAKARRPILDCEGSSRRAWLLPKLDTRTLSDGASTRSRQADAQVGDTAECGIPARLKGEGNDEDTNNH
jgi:hypothetical protein